MKEEASPNINATIGAIEVYNFNSNEYTIILGSKPPRYYRDQFIEWEFSGSALAKYRLFVNETPNFNGYHKCIAVGELGELIALIAKEDKIEQSLVGYLIKENNEYILPSQQQELDEVVQSRFGVKNYKAQSEMLRDILKYNVEAALNAPVHGDDFLSTQCGDKLEDVLEMVGLEIPSKELMSILVNRGIIHE